MAKGVLLGCWWYSGYQISKDSDHKAEKWSMILGRHPRWCILLPGIILCWQLKMHNESYLYYLSHFLFLYYVVLSSTENPDLWITRHDLFFASCPIARPLIKCTAIGRRVQPKTWKAHSDFPTMDKTQPWCKITPPSFNRVVSFT